MLLQILLAIALGLLAGIVTGKYTLNFQAFRFSYQAVPFRRNRNKADDQNT